MISNRFSEPAQFQISTDILVREGQNVRLTIELIDYVADLVQDNAMARTSIEAFLDYGENIFSPITNVTCSLDCLKGKFDGNLGKFILREKIHIIFRNQFYLPISSKPLVRYTKFESRRLYLYFNY